MTILRPFVLPSNLEKNWLGRAWSCLCYLWPIKALGTMLFIFLFFQGYFWVQGHPLNTPVVMPHIFLDGWGWLSFHPWGLPIYLLLWPYVSLAPALIKNQRQLVLYTFWISLLCIVCLLIFWILPSQTPIYAMDWSQYPLLARVKGIDAVGNACPSLHVASAVFTSLWMHRLLRQLQAPHSLLIINHGICLAISWSTLATLQHVALDVIAGAAVGGVFAALSLRQQPDKPTQIPA